LLFAALTGAAPAAAVEPTRDTVSVQRVANPFVVCDGYAIRGDFDVVRDITTFYDAAGIPVRRIIHATIEGSVSNAITGASLPVSSVRVFQVDLLTGTMTSTGSNVLVRVPGASAVVLGAGRLVFDASGAIVDAHGPDSGREVEQLCAALAA